MARSTALVAAVVVLLPAAYGGWALITNAGGVTAAPPDERGERHEQMHAMMDGMMGSGASERMHAAMPGSEAMMEACTQAMEGRAGDGGMMNGMMRGGMTGGMMEQ
jgi:NAD(P)H-flavin reductase